MSIRSVLGAIFAACVLASASLAGDDVVSFDLAMEDGRLLGSSDVVRVTRGTTVELRWTSDRTVEVHIHGYDLVLNVLPGRPAVQVFEAPVAGRFPITLHGAQGHRHRTVAYLEVIPE